MKWISEAKTTAIKKKVKEEEKFFKVPPRALQLRPGVEMSINSDDAPLPSGRLSLFFRLKEKEEEEEDPSQQQLSPSSSFSFPKSAAVHGRECAVCEREETR